MFQLQLLPSRELDGQMLSKPPHKNVSGNVRLVYLDGRIMVIRVQIMLASPSSEEFLKLVPANFHLIGNRETFPSIEDPSAKNMSSSNGSKLLFLQGTLQPGCQDFLLEEPIPCFLGSAFKLRKKTFSLPDLSPFVEAFSPSFPSLTKEHMAIFLHCYQRKIMAVFSSLHSFISPIA